MCLGGLQHRPEILILLGGQLQSRPQKLEVETVYADKYAVDQYRSLLRKKHVSFGPLPVAPTRQELDGGQEREFYIRRKGYPDQGRRCNHRREASCLPNITPHALLKWRVEEVYHSRVGEPESNDRQKTSYDKAAGDEGLKVAKQGREHDRLPNWVSAAWRERRVSMVDELPKVGTNGSDVEVATNS
jgi:hypothetical protein